MYFIAYRPAAFHSGYVTSIAAVSWADRQNSVVVGFLLKFISRRPNNRTWMYSLLSFFRNIIYIDDAIKFCFLHIQFLRNVKGFVFPQFHFTLLMPFSFRLLQDSLGCCFFCIINNDDFWINSCLIIPFHYFAVASFDFVFLKKALGIRDRCTYILKYRGVKICSTYLKINNYNIGNRIDKIKINANIIYRFVKIRDYDKMLLWNLSNKYN